MTDWEGIVRQYGALVWQTAYRLLGDRADVADCFQETFVSALDVARRETVLNWAGLLRRLATARALDLLRKRMREGGRRDSTPDWEEFRSAAAGPGEHAQAAELGERLQAALGRLPQQQAEVFCLRHINGLSYEEISDQTGMTVDAVGVTLHRARGRLRELLDEPCGAARVQR